MIEEGSNFIGGNAIRREVGRRGGNDEEELERNIQFERGMRGGRGGRFHQFLFNCWLFYTHRVTIQDGETKRMIFIIINIVIIINIFIIIIIIITIIIIIIIVIVIVVVVVVAVAAVVVVAV